MATVQGVLGPIDTADLGFTLMHEHVLVMSWSMRQALPGWLARDELVAHAVAEAQAARERGIRTMVDLTPVNLGRDIAILREVAEKAEMQIIAATGTFPFSFGGETSVCPFAIGSCLPPCDVDYGVVLELGVIEILISSLRSKTLRQCAYAVTYT